MEPAAGVLRPNLGKSIRARDGAGLDDSRA